MFPKDDKEFDTWQSHFVSGFRKHGLDLGFKDRDIKEVEDLIEDHKTAYVTTLIKKAELEQALEENKAKKEHVSERLIQIIEKIKGHKRYTATIGEEMGLEGETDIASLLLLQPRLNLVKNEKGVDVHFDSEATDGIIIYSKRGKERKYRILGVETSSPYLDTRKKLNPEEEEERYYYAYYIVCGFFTSKKSKVEKMLV